MRNVNAKLLLQIVASGILVNSLSGGETAAEQVKNALRYYNGENGKVDYASAFENFRKAAEQGNAEAQYYLGSCFLNGTGTARNPQEAARWFAKAAEQKLPAAQMWLGICYQKGLGVKQNDAEALKYLTFAADNNLA